MMLFRIAILFSTCLAWLTTSMGAEYNIVRAESNDLLPSIDSNLCPKLRIAIVNGVSFHFEVQSQSRSKAPDVVAQQFVVARRW